MTSTTCTVGDSTISAIGYGAMGLGAFYHTVLPDEERLKVLDAVHENGCTHLDTADVYGDSEIIIGKWLKKTGLRDKVFLATKFATVLQEGGLGVRNDPEHMAMSLEKSLTNLGVGYIDLWYLHRADTKTSIELTIAAMAEYVKAGKVKYIGLSEVSAETLRRAHAVHPISVLQVEYSAFTLDIEDETNATARELGVKIFAYSPVGRGLLTGKIRSPDDIEPSDTRHWLPRFSKENFPNVLKIVDSINAIGEKHGATPGQVALAWLLAQGDDIVPIPGSTKPANIQENMDALKLKLTPEEIDEIRKLAMLADKTIGPRYPPGYTANLLADTPPLK